VEAILLTLRWAAERLAREAAAPHWEITRLVPGLTQTTLALHCPSGDLMKESAVVEQRLDTREPVTLGLGDTIILDGGWVYWTPKGQRPQEPRRATGCGGEWDIRLVAAKKPEEAPC
jgi:hypothetical protein